MAIARQQAHQQQIILALQQPSQHGCFCLSVSRTSDIIMSDWSPSDGGNKRRAEQILQVASKRHHLGDVNPGREYVEPRVYQQPNYSQDHQQHEVRVWYVLKQRPVLKQQLT